MLLTPGFCEEPPALRGPRHFQFRLPASLLCEETLDESEPSTPTTTSATTAAPPTDLTCQEVLDFDAIGAIYVDALEDEREVQRGLHTHRAGSTKTGEASTKAGEASTKAGAPLRFTRSCVRDVEPGTCTHEASVTRARVLHTRRAGRPSQSLPSWPRSRCGSTHSTPLAARPCRSCWAAAS